jgi:hypothetical protein
MTSFQKTPCFIAAEKDLEIAFAMGVMLDYILYEYA